MPKSAYLDNKDVDHNLGTAPFTKPTAVYVALYTSNPTAADSGTEVVGGSYARQAATFSASSAGATANTGVLNFVGMPAAVVTHFGVRDAASGGNLLYYGPLTASKTTNPGDTLQVGIGALTVSET